MFLFFQGDKLSLIALLAPKSTTKTMKKITRGGSEVELQDDGVCVEESSTLAYIVDEGRFRAGKFGNYPKPPLHATIQPPAEAGPGPCHLWCGRTAPWLARLATAFGRWVGGWACPLLRWCVGPGNCVGGLSPFSSFAHF
jgi:hypothetical protein